jgi:hypothetical protein
MKLSRIKSKNKFRNPNQSKMLAIILFFYLFETIFRQQNQFYLKRVGRDI